MIKKISLSLIFVAIFGFSNHLKAQNDNIIENKEGLTKQAYIGPIYTKGNNLFVKDFLAMVHAYIDLDNYYVNGKFNFKFYIDEKGKIENIDVSPKVKNSELFIEDMIFSAKKVKGKWFPALLDGVPVKSSISFSINFTTHHIDI